MEQAYKMILKMIITLIENDEYLDRKVIKNICEIALGDDEDGEV